MTDLTEYEQHWRVLSLDVWGNDEDGYEVNDQTDVGGVVLRGEDYQDDQKVIDVLMEAGFLSALAKDGGVSVDGDEYFLYVTGLGRPLLTLVRDQRS